VRPAEADDAVADGEGEPGELGDPAPDCVGLGDVELGDELADAELEVGDPEVAGNVTVNCSMAMGALPLAAG
jgi:hypothetical protein